MLHDSRREVVRQPRNQPSQHLGHHIRRQRVQGQTRPVGTHPREVRPAQRQHEDREVRRPLEEVFDEVEQAGVGPLEVLEQEDDRMLVREALEEQPPAGEQVRPVRGDALLEPQEMR